MDYKTLTLVFCFLGASMTHDGLAQQYNGLGSGMDNLFRLSKAKTRSISPENFTGEKGKAGMATEGTGANAARDLGRGWKISPSVKIKAGETFVLADIKASGAIQQIWMTPTAPWRYSILRMYWDDEADPSVEVPIGCAKAFITHKRFGFFPAWYSVLLSSFTDSSKSRNSVHS